MRKSSLDDLELGDDLSLDALARSAVPESGKVQRAQAELAIRDAAEKAAVGLERPWRDAVRDASHPGGVDIVDELDQAISATSVDAGQASGWWRVVQALQVLAVIALIGGLAWWALQGVAELASFELPDLGQVAGVPTAAVVAGGALVFGIVAAVLSRVGARIGGQRKAARADRDLRAAIQKVTDERVIAPIQAELDSYRRYRTGVLAALK
ncbi:hypothetical protein [Aeromicrobium sp. UC242_57]|uniref:hypothetical protein n=1 Tax=Aeromicrobium sp. UC242_57 TaxID=3374624 RepID=UPI0037A7AAE8